MVLISDDGIEQSVYDKPMFKTKLKICVSYHGMSIIEAIIHGLSSSFLLTWCSHNSNLSTS